MNMKEIINSIGKNACVKSFLPHQTAFLLPKMVLRGGKPMAEMLYYMVRAERSPYELTPVSFRIIFDWEARRPALLENIMSGREDQQVYLESCGTFVEMKERNAQFQTDMADYIALFNSCLEALEREGSISRNQVQALDSAWHKCIPAALKNWL